MKWNRALIGMMVALVVGILASRFVYRQIQKASQVKPVALTKVVVAARPLQLGTSLQPNDVRLIDWPASEPLAGSFSDAQQCENRAVITGVSPNEPILEEKLAPREAGVGLPAAIPQGMRAVSVRVDEVIGVAGFVMPGTMVDVLMTGDPKGSQSDSVTRTILEDVRVLAAGEQVQQDKDGKPQKVSVVTLLVNPEQADKLTMAAMEGRLQLALRNTVDTKNTNPPPVFRTALLLGEHASAPAPAGKRASKAHAPEAHPAYVVEVIRGDKREDHTFPVQ